MSRLFEVLKAVFGLVAHDVLNDISLAETKVISRDKLHWLNLEALVMLSADLCVEWIVVHTVNLILPRICVNFLV